MEGDMHMRNMLTKSTALRFVLIIGIVNLFADLTYEGARSINGQFLGVLGASAYEVLLLIFQRVEKQGKW
jgi:hypothetical protein